MKTTLKILLALILTVSLAFPVMLLAQGYGPRGGGPGYGQGYGNNQRGSGAGPVLRSEMWAAKLEVLANLTGKSVDEVKAELENKPFPLVLEESNVKWSKFHAALQAKNIAIVDKAVADGKITKAHGDFMKERMSQGPKGPRGKFNKRGGGWGPGGYGDCPRGFRR